LTFLLYSQQNNHYHHETTIQECTQV